MKYLFKLCAIYHTTNAQNLSLTNALSKITEQKTRMSISITITISKNFYPLWRCRGLNPGPFTCKANALPLRYIPILILELINEHISIGDVDVINTMLRNRTLVWIFEIIILQKW